MRLAEYRPIEDQVRVLGDGDEVELVCCGAKGYYLPVVVMAINVCAGDALMHIVYPKDTIDGSFHGPHDVKRMVMLPPSERSGAWAVPVRVSEPHEPAYERESVCWVDDNAVMPDRALMLEYGMEDVAGRSAWGTMRIVPVCRGVHMAECGGRPCVTRSERYREHCECLCGRPIEPPVSETCPPPEGGCGG